MTNQDCFLTWSFTDLIFIDIMVVYAKTDAEIAFMHGKKISFYLLGQSLMKHIYLDLLFSLFFIVRFVSGSGF